MSVKYVFITGGVVSSLGKGLTAASIASLLESMGIEISMLKLDPYLNVDPGTMNPFQHGEVYVTDDGSETDLDLGHYFRYTNANVSKYSNATAGQIYETVIKKERKGDYLGKTVQVIPHITNEIKKRIVACQKHDQNSKVVFVEIGGTVGDIESLPFLEAIRQFRNERPKDCINIHLTYVPYIKAAGEVKSKPTQHSVQMLREIGLFPDILICRSENNLTDELKSKISLFCNVDKTDVIDEKDVDTSIYEVPIDLHSQGIDKKICEKLSITPKKSNVDKWQKLLKIIKKPKGKITVGIVGKYMDHQDAYKSVFEALSHGAFASEVEIDIKRFESDKIIENDSVEKALKGCDGYLVPGGFGERGLLGKILTAKYCREKNIPYLGICLGMQSMAIEFARNVLKLENAHSTEFDENTKFPIISLITDQREIENLGGTMRLGSYPCVLKEKSKSFQAYKKKLVAEIHRHRYEFNNEFNNDFEKHGMEFAGVLKDGKLCEIIEIKNHPWMIGVQFHPEFKSKPFDAHPLFRDFIKAMLKHQKKS